MRHRGFSLLDSLIALALSLMAAAGTYALTRSAVELYRQHQLDRVIANITDHLQALPTRPDGEIFELGFNRLGEPVDGKAKILARLETHPVENGWSEIRGTVEVNAMDQQHQIVPLKRMVWRP